MQIYGRPHFIIAFFFQIKTWVIHFFVVGIIMSDVLRGCSTNSYFTMQLGTFVHIARRYIYWSRTLELNLESNIYTITYG